MASVKVRIAHECKRHFTAVRCAHFDGRSVALYQTKWEGLYEVTTGFDERPGSLTFPISNERKEWAFNREVIQWLHELPIPEPVEVEGSVEA